MTRTSCVAAAVATGPIPSVSAVGAPTRGVTDDLGAASRLGVASQARRRIGPNASKSLRVIGISIGNRERFEHMFVVRN
jgi:hypothetical protein